MIPGENEVLPIMKIEVCRLDDPAFTVRDIDGTDAPPLFTIGYQGRTLDQFIGILKENRIESVIDIRFSTVSRFKPEFRDSNLTRELPRAGIRYVHHKELGVPYAWQNPYKAGAIPFECLEKFYRWNVKKNSDFKAFISSVKESSPAALMCFERYATPTRGQKIACHRSILAAMLLESGEFERVIHL